MSKSGMLRDVNTCDVNTFIYTYATKSGERTLVGWSPNNRAEVTDIDYTRSDDMAEGAGLSERAIGRCGRGVFTGCSFSARRMVFRRNVGFLATRGYTRTSGSTGCLRAELSRELFCSAILSNARGARIVLFFLREIRVPIVFRRSRGSLQCVCVCAFARGG